jgi:hypothetical protein
LLMTSVTCLDDLNRDIEFSFGQKGVSPEMQGQVII